MGGSSPRASRGRSHRCTEAFAKVAGVPAFPRRGSPGVREHAWSHLENRRRPARSRDWTTDRLVASVFAPARVGAFGFGLGMSGFSSVSPSPTGHTVVRWNRALIARWFLSLREVRRALCALDLVRAETHDFPCDIAQRRTR